MDQYSLRAGITTGRIESNELGTHHIEDGQLTVEDYDTAAALVDHYNSITWSDGDPGEPSGNADEDTDGDIVGVADGDSSDDDTDTSGVEEETVREETEDDDTPEPEIIPESESEPESDTVPEFTQDSNIDTEPTVPDGEGDSPDDVEECGTIMSSGEPCERPADECPYHE